MMERRVIDILHGIFSLHKAICVMEVVRFVIRGSLVPVLQVSNVRVLSFALNTTILHYVSFWLEQSSLLASLPAPSLSLSLQWPLFAKCVSRSFRVTGL